MTRLNGAPDAVGRALAALMPAGTQRDRPACVPAGSWLRLGVGATALLVTAMAARRGRIGACEARTFRAVNDLPDSLYVPTWAVMQLGTLGAAPAAAGAAWLAGEGELAVRLLAGGTGTWALSKLVKRLVRRPRPAVLLAGVRCRGRPAAGLGYLSGHAGVAVALGAAALPHLGPGGRASALAAVPVVGLSRVYVGAHLPLDVAGGAGLGLAVDAAVVLVMDAAAGCRRSSLSRASAPGRRRGPSRRPGAARIRRGRRR